MHQWPHEPDAQGSGRDGQGCAISNHPVLAELRKVQLVREEHVTAVNGAGQTRSSNLEKAAAAESENLTGSVKAMQFDFSETGRIHAPTMVRSCRGGYASTLTPSNLASLLGAHDQLLLRVQPVDALRIHFPTFSP